MGYKRPIHKEAKFKSKSNRAPKLLLSNKKEYSLTSSKDISGVYSTAHSKSQLSRKIFPKIKNQKKTRNKTYKMIVGNKLFKMSTKILKEIRKYQTSTENVLPKLPFSRLVREILLRHMPQGGCIQPAALQALQEAAEAYVVQILEDSYCCTLHARRNTLLPRDIGLIQHLRGDD